MKKIACLILAAAVGLAACVNTTGGSGSPKPAQGATQAAAQTYKPGTYVGIGEGNGGEIKVEVVFTGDKLASVKVLSLKETPGVFDQVRDVLLKEVVERQSLGVDTVSGATASSKGVLDAIADCVRQAGGDDKALRTPVAERASAPVELKADVVVVGLGSSGILAAVGAANKGATVIGVEKAASIANTNATKTTGAWIVGSEEQLKYPNPLTKEEAFRNMMDGSKNQCNAQTIRTFVERSGDAMNLILEGGMKFMFPFADPKASDIMSRGGHVFTSPNDERARVFEKMLSDRKVQTLFNTTAKSLIVEGGAVRGVVCERRDGGKVTIRSKSVVLCTGGFIANPEMVAKYFGGARINSLGSTGCTGDGIVMAQAAGAQVGKNFAISLNEFGGSNAKASTKSAKEPWYPQSDVFKLPILGGLIVNAAGQRFMDEGEMCEKTMYTSEPVVRNSRYYSIVDASYVEKLSSTEILQFLGATSNMSPITAASYKGMVLKTLPAQLDAAIAEGWAWKADSIEALSKKAKLGELGATVARYDAYCDQGRDEQYFKKAAYLSSVKKGPFYAVEFEPSAWVTMGGLKTDGSFRVLDAENRPVPGLYTAGADADQWSVPYFQGGSCLGFSFTSGLVAGEGAAGER